MVVAYFVYNWSFLVFFSCLQSLEGIQLCSLCKPLTCAKLSKNCSVKFSKQ